MKTLQVGETWVWEFSRRFGLEVRRISKPRDGSLGVTGTFELWPLRPDSVLRAEEELLRLNVKTAGISYVSSGVDHGKQFLIIEDVVLKTIRDDGVKLPEKATPDLSKMSVEELKAHQRELYETAKKDGVLTICYAVGHRGKKLAGPYTKYLWKMPVDDISIFIDDYGGYMTVHVGDKLVCSTHYCEHLFIPGRWVEVVMNAFPEAEQLEKEHQAALADAERKKLIDKLTAPWETP